MTYNKNGHLVPIPLKHAREVKTHEQHMFDEDLNMAWTRTITFDNRASRGIQSYREHKEFFDDLDRLGSRNRLIGDTVHRANQHKKSQPQENSQSSDAHLIFICGATLMGLLNIVILLLIGTARNF